ncbi:MAG: diguanylate cyclase [Thermoanaerobaculia bacterium]
MWNRRFVLALLFYALDLAFVQLPRLTETSGREQLRWIVYTAIVALFAALSLVVLWRRPRDPRVAMFALVGVMIALYFVPASVEWSSLSSAWRPAILMAFGFMYTFDFAIYIHVSSLIPTPNPIAFGGRWFIPAHYAAAVVLSIVIGLLLVAPFEPALGALVPGDPMETAESLLRVRSMYAAVMMIVLLGSAARRSASLDGRRQALICLVSVIPWGLSVARQLFFPWSEAIPAFEVTKWLVVLIVPIGFFLAILGFRLFEVGTVLRKGLIYGLSLGVVVAAFWVALVSLGQVAGSVVGSRAATWGVALLLVLGGVALRPVAQRITALVDRTLFHEKKALREFETGVIADLAQFANTGQVAQRLASRLHDALGSERVAVFLADDSGDFYRPRAFVGVEGDPPIDAVLTAEQLATVPLRRAPLLRGDGAGESPALRRTLDALGARCLVPIEHRGERIGFLTLGDNATGPLDLDRDDLGRLASIATAASVMLENSRLTELAMRDPLTGLPRRQVFEERLTEELKRFSRSGQPFAVGIGDADRFKAINDTRGHLAGDRVLRAIATALADEARSSDVVARWGGEEFAILLPGTDLEGATSLVERLRQRVEALAIASDGDELRVTVSFGVAVIDGDACALGAEAVFKRADEALYRAKQGGRNRIEITSAGAQA